MKLNHSRYIASLILVALAFSQIACSGGFSQQLRLVLLASPPLIESLPLPPALKSGLITDFTDMAGHTATLGDCIKGASGKPAKLFCVQAFQQQVETIIARGNFGQAGNEKLQRVLSLIRAIIASAVIYYGGTAPAGFESVSQGKVTEDSIKAQIKQLEKEMKP